MEHSIGQVAKMTGMSSRTLRHYDTLGLFPPSRVGPNGYRWYHQSQMPRLYRILALRRSGLSLPDIQHVLREKSDEASALRERLQDLRLQRDQIDALMTSLEADLGHLERAHIDDLGTFDADFTRESAAQRERLHRAHGDAAVAAFDHAAVDPASMTAGDKEHAIAEGSAFMLRLASLMLTGLAPDDPQVLDVVADHYAMTCRIWTPNPNSYRALGQIYVHDK
jgi:DNA-binding transcriptional MerR regulator